MRTARIVLAWAVACATLIGSVSGLWSVAVDSAKMPLPGAVAVIACLDAAAIVAGLRVVERHDDLAAWLLLLFLAAVSASAQVIAANPNLEWWRLVHGIPPLGTLWTMHAALSGDKAKKGPERPERKRPPRATQTENQGGRSVAAAGPAASPHPAAAGSPGSRTLELVHGAGREGAGRSPQTSGPPPHTTESLAVLVRTKLDGRPISKRAVQEAVREITGSCGAAKRDAVYEALIMADDEEEEVAP